MAEKRLQLRYLYRMPKTVPAGLVVVHNHIQPTRLIGLRGFRIWLSRRGSKRLEVCNCTWAPELKRHFRVVRPTI